MPWLDFGLLAAVAVVAAAVQGATGFGFAVVATLPFLLIVDSLAAVQLIIALSLVVSAVLAPGLWRAAPRGLLLRLVLASLLGLPVGLLLYRLASLAAVQLAVGALIVAFTLWLLIGRRSTDPVPSPSRPLTELAVGFVSGAMTTSLGMPGPVVVLHLVARDLPKTAARATTLTLFTLAYAAALLLQATLGGMTGSTWAGIAILVPAAILGAWLGARWSSRLDGPRFRAAVLILLLLTGLSAIAAGLS